MIIEIDKINELISNNQHFVVIQADNPDGDSLATALALESILEDMGKTVDLYCGVEVPGYLKFIEGWSRVKKELPSKFDASIIVDTSANGLLEKLNDSPYKISVATKPVLVIDHHGEVDCDIPYASVISNNPGYASAGEVVYDIAKALGWKLSQLSSELILQSILSDTLGLTSDMATPETYRRVADIIDSGVNRSKLEEARKEMSKMEPDVFRYKAKLIERTEFFLDNSIALIEIPESELFDVGTLYNPGPLILSEVLMVSGVKVGIALKVYKKRLTGSIRCGGNIKIANELAGKYGGGGNAFAAGFRVDDFAGDIKDFKNELIRNTIGLIK